MAARQLEHRLRSCDVVAPVYDDTIAVMLVGTGGIGQKQRKLLGEIANRERYGRPFELAERL
jgi:hypothetical protein